MNCTLLQKNAVLNGDAAALAEKKIIRDNTNSGGLYQQNTVTVCVKTI